MMVVKNQVVGIFFELGLGKFLVRVGLRLLDLVQQRRVYLGEDVGMWLVNSLSVSNGDAIKSHQVRAVVSFELFEVQHKRVKVIDRHLVVLDHHVRTVVDWGFVYVVLLLSFFLVILFSVVWNFGFSQRQNTQELNFVILTDGQFF